MKQYLSLGSRLALFVASVVLMLSLVNMLTRDTIAERQRIAGETARGELLSGTFTEVTDFTIPEAEAKTVTAVYRAEENGVVTGYCFDVTVKGYDEMTMIVGVNTDLIVTGVKILTQSETPGIGSKAVDENGAFLPQFKGLSSRNLDSVSIVSGATVSSVGIQSGVRSAVTVCSLILEGKGE
ncbi:MAG: FMN-binding protein [Clostridia bacterium]|nr:FMN-binding protein [Clostridia bacterium]